MISVVEVSFVACCGVNCEECKKDLEETSDDDRRADDTLERAIRAIFCVATMEDFVQRPWQGYGPTHL